MTETRFRSLLNVLLAGLALYFAWLKFSNALRSL